jgi:hypothetical protein
MAEDEPQPTVERERSIARAHAIVRAFVRAATSAAGEDPHTLVSLLRKTLPSHFAFEERPNGFFDHLEGRGVSVLLMDRLRAEHQEFLTRLARLEEAIERGESVQEELVVLAERLREHEWIESMTAAQRGMFAPADPPADPIAPNLDPALAASLTAIADRCRALASESTTGDLLAGVTVSVPEAAPAEGVLAQLEHALSERGLDFVEITLTRADEVRLGGARFRRPRVGRYLRSNFSIR